jgi:hypothetical protein
MKTATLGLAALTIVAALGFGGRAPAAAEPSAFDGAWDVTLTCPPLRDDVDDAKGYTQRFSGQVKDGTLRATHGVEGQPSWHLLTGEIPPDGKAMLTIEGIVKSADYAVNNAPRGKAYTFRVRATFEGNRGTGVRLGKRKCEFDFRRR